MNSWISTYTGKTIDPFDPNPDDIDIIDIAHALSNICRFTGHCSAFYSVAQHCVLMAMAATGNNKRWALLHDASEAYICDISSPVKHHKSFQAYREAEANLQDCIYEKFGLYGPAPDEIKNLDTRMLVTEARQFGLFSGDWSLSHIKPFNVKILPLQPNNVKTLFLSHYTDLFMPE
jgi:hypothetical protein